MISHASRGDYEDYWTENHGWCWGRLLIESRAQFIFSSPSLLLLLLSTHKQAADWFVGWQLRQDREIEGLRMDGECANEISPNIFLCLWFDALCKAAAISRWVAAAIHLQTIYFFSFSFRSKEGDFYDTHAPALFAVSCVFGCKSDTRTHILVPLRHEKKEWVRKAKKRCLPSLRVNDEAAFSQQGETFSPHIRLYVCATIGGWREKKIQRTAKNSENKIIPKKEGQQKKK